MSQNIAADYGREHFLAALQSLLPQGAAWPREPDALLTQLLDGFAAGFAALHARLAVLSESESVPDLSVELLGDWERAYGLPDACAPDVQTLQERRAALLARIAAQGGQSRAYYISVAAALGFTVTIEEFRPFRFGRGRFGEPIWGEPWAFAWRVRAPETTVTPFRFGRSAFGEALRVWGNGPLECALTPLKPAHTVLIFAYGS